MYQNKAIILIGNKSDLEYDRKVKNKHAEAEASKIGVKYFEVSAKTSSKDDIDKLISELVDMNEMQKFYSNSTTGTNKSKS